MTLLEKLQGHIGGLVRIKTELYWYKTNKWDGAHESVYLLLDTLDPDDVVDIGVDVAGSAGHAYDPPVAVLLFIDGAFKWIWTHESSLELVK